jgi:quercetin dioxygenase-like cupin family protein
MKCKLLLSIVLTLFYTHSFAQTFSLPAGCIQFTPTEMKWIDTLSTLPKGTSISFLYGDIKKEGPYAVRLKFPPNLFLKKHYHAKDEVVTVLEGTISVGFSDRTPPGLKAFNAGSFYVNAANVEHYVMVGPEGATIQINAMGPWTIKYK